MFVDQSPLQNYTSDGGWGPDYGNKSCNSAEALAHIQTTLRYRPEDVYDGMIVSCLAYLYDPQVEDGVTEGSTQSDWQFFLSIAQEGDPQWFGKLMADHTSLDWRDSINVNFGGDRGSMSRVLVIASNRSGCFPPAGPLKVVN